MIKQPEREPDYIFYLTLPNERVAHSFYYFKEMLRFHSKSTYSDELYYRNGVLYTKDAGFDSRFIDEIQNAYQEFLFTIEVENMLLGKE